MSSLPLARWIEGATQIFYHIIFQPPQERLATFARLRNCICITVQRPR